MTDPDLTGQDAHLEALLDRVAATVQADDSLLRASSQIRESAFHDFAHFEYMLPPLTTAPSGMAKAGLAGSVAAAVSEGLAQFWRWLERTGANEGREESFDRRDHEPEYSDAGVAAKLMSGELVGAMETEFGLRNGGAAVDWSSDFGVALAGAVKAVMRDEMAEWEARSTPELDALIDNSDTGSRLAALAWDMAGRGWSVGVADFPPYTPGSVNFGLQTVYRQTWTPLGVQTGEIVRTLPLGPGQTEKVSVKVVRRRKSSRSAEIATSTETSSETTDTTKDSQEIVEESAKSFNWNVSASGSYGVGFASASISAGMGGEKSSRSSETKSQLNEAMSKSASKMRRDTKVVISTESEQTFESATTSEISNRNDEIAVTYVYSKLQRQYEVSTFLAEINTVAFVAERVPSKTELTESWFRRHAPVIERALLDAGLADDLRRVGWGAPTSVQETDRTLSSIIESYASDVPDYSTSPGTPPDALGALSLVYEREIERSRLAGSGRQLFAASLVRLREHVYDNILHYCRAIWSAEDPDMRQMRYSQIRVPTRWTLRYLNADYRSLMGYQPEITGPENSEPLSEVINPAGPIAYSGNYAVFYLKQRRKWSDLLDLLAVMRQPYLRVVTSVDAPAGIDVRVAPSPDIVESRRFRIRLLEDGLEVDDWISGGWNHYARTPSGSIGGFGGELDLGLLRLKVRATEGASLEVGDSIEVALTVVPTLEDPELRWLRWSEDPPALDVEAEVFDVATLDSMAGFVPAVANAIGDARDWQDLDEPARTVVRDHYHEYLLYDSHTRRLLVDTDNLVLNRIVDDSSTIEPFKSAHRYLDVLSAATELELKRAEAARLRQRLAAQQLGDPDTERTVVIGADVEPTIDPLNP